MVNPMMGEARAELAGRELTLRFDMEAAACLEAPEIGDLRINELLAEMQGPVLPGTDKPSFRRPRLASQVAMLYAATRFHHREVTLEQATALMVASDSNGVLFWPLMSAFARFLGKDDESEGGAADADLNPPQSAPGISTSSSSDGAQQGSTLTDSGDKPATATVEQ